MKAGAILDAAGYPLKGDKRFSREFTYMAVSPFYAIAKSVATQWKEADVRDLVGKNAGEFGVNDDPQ